MDFVTDYRETLAGELECGAGDTLWTRIGAAFWAARRALWYGYEFQEW